MHKYFVFILILGLLQNISAQAASFQAKLDSVIYVKSQKTTYVYDTDGRIEYMLLQGWVEHQNKWDYPTKTSYEYDNTNRLVLSFYSTWNLSSQNYQIQSKRSYSYTEAGTIFQSIASVWSNNQWINSSKQEFSYNANNQILSESEYLWESNKWNTNFKKEYTYDNTGNELSEIFSLPNSQGTGWRLSSKTEKSYTSDNKVISTIRSNYDTSTSKWIPFDKNENSYNTETDLVEKSTKYYWNGDSWEKSAETTYAYNTKNELIRESYKEIESLGSGVSFKTEWTYDDFGNINKEENATWNTSTLGWEYSWKTEFLYNTSYPSSIILSPSDYPTEYKYMISEKRGFDYAEGNWVANTNDALYFYTILHTNIPFVSSITNTVLYINNTTKTLALNHNVSDSATIYIWNMNGELIKSINTKDFPLNINCLSQGVYLYQLVDGENNFSGKFLKK